MLKFILELLLINLKFLILFLNFNFIKQVIFLVILFNLNNFIILLHEFLFYIMITVKIHSIFIVKYQFTLLLVLIVNQFIHFMINNLYFIQLIYEFSF